MAKKTTSGLFPVPAAPTPPAVDGTAALTLAAPDARTGHPGQRDPFFIPAGASPDEVQFWTDMHVVLGNAWGPETPEEAEGNLWLVLWVRASETNPELASTLRQLRAWGCRLGWTRQGNLRLNWRPCLPSVPEMVCSTAHRMEILSRNQAALVGVPEEHHGRLVTLLERYLEPFRDELGRVFRETAAAWPEEARW